MFRIGVYPGLEEVSAELVVNWYFIVQYGTVWYVMIYRGMLWYIMVKHDICTELTRGSSFLFTHLRLLNYNAEIC